MEEDFEEVGDFEVVDLVEDTEAVDLVEDIVEGLVAVEDLLEGQELHE